MSEPKTPSETPNDQEQLTEESLEAVSGGVHEGGCTMPTIPRLPFPDMEKLPFPLPGPNPFESVR